MSDMEESRDRGGAIQLYLFYYFRYCTQWSRMSGMDGASGGRDERPIQYSWVRDLPQGVSLISYHTLQCSKWSCNLCVHIAQYTVHISQWTLNSAVDTVYCALCQPPCAGVMTSSHQQSTEERLEPYYRQNTVLSNVHRIGEGVSGHCLIWASGMLPPKLRHIWGCLAFSEFFLVKNLTLRRSNHFLKIQWKIHFFTFLNIDRNASKKKLE